MLLIEPTKEYTRQLSEYRREFLDSGSSSEGLGSFLGYEDPLEWLAKVDAYKSAETVPKGRIPSTQYIFMREEDDKIVGMIQIRHCFNDYLSKYGGLISYSVAPSERRKGYASMMLGMALTKCKELGLDKVLITCLRENEASRRTILKSGGVYESTIYETDEDIYLERYWLDIK